MTRSINVGCVIVCFCLTSMVSAQIRGPLVVSDGWPETTDLLTWVEDVFRIEGVSQASERDRGIAFYRWLKLFNRLCEGDGGMAHAVEGPYGEEAFVRDAHKHLFVYGWGHCATHSLIAEALWQEYMGDPLAADRVIVMHEDGGYHTMFRLRLDGHFGAFDARYSYYLLESDSPDARILDWEEVGDDRNILANMRYENRCRPFFEFPQKEFERGLWVKPRKIFDSEADWRAAGTEPEAVFRDRHYQMGTKFHDMRFQLVRGMTIERFWDNSAKQWYMPKNAKDMFLPEGRFYRVGASMVGADGEKNDPNLKYMKPYFTTVPRDSGYPVYLEGDQSLGQAWGKVVYRPELGRADLEQVRLVGDGLRTDHRSPYLRPVADGGEGEWILEFYSPYVLVSGFVKGNLVAGAGDSVEVALRSQVPKRSDLSEADRWLEWKTLAKSGGAFQASLDRTNAAAGESSFHGAYRYQLRLRFKSTSGADQVGLDDLEIFTFFENGIMSIPQIFDGENVIRFKVDDSSQITSDLLVTYNWLTTDGGVRSHTKRVYPALFFSGNEAVYSIHSPDLQRCLSLKIAYP